jgi:hypothetical protein
MLIEGLCCLMRFFKEEKQQQKSKPEAYLIADMFHLYTIENLCFLGWNLLQGYVLFFPLCLD